MKLDFDRKYTSVELNQMDAIDIYRLVLNGKHVKSFPKGFWQKPEALDNVKKVTKFLIEELLKINIEDLPNYTKQELLGANKLVGMCNRLNLDLYEVLNLTYPNRFKLWEIKILPKEYWTITNATACVKWLIEDKLKWDDEDIKSKLNIQTFKTNGLYGILQVYGTSTFKLINLAYPNRFKPWELTQVRANFWDTENIIKATKWLIEDKLKWNMEDVKNKLTSNTFVENGLVSVLTNCNSSVYVAINLAYPNRFKPWEFKRVSKGFWTEDNMIKATKWLIEEKLNWNEDDIKNKLNGSIFIEHGLGGLLHLTKGYPYALLNLAYPDKFKPWELSEVSDGFWNKTNTHNAVKWLIEEKLKIKDLNGIYNISTQTFIDNGVYSLVKHNNYVTLLKEVYPELDVNKFKNINYLTQDKIKEMNIF